MDIKLPEDLAKAIDNAALLTDHSIDDIFRRALQLYLAALEGKRSGLTVALFDPDTEEVRTEVVGL